MILRKLAARRTGDRSRYAVEVDGRRVGEVWSHVVVEERRHWRTGRGPARYVRVVYWSNGDGDLHETRAEAVRTLLQRNPVNPLDAPRERA